MMATRSERVDPPPSGYRDHVPGQFVCTRQYYGMQCGQLVARSQVSAHNSWHDSLGG